MKLQWDLLFASTSRDAAYQALQRALSALDAGRIENAHVAAQEASAILETVVQFREAAKGKT